MAAETSEYLEYIFKALSHWQRRSMLELLLGGEKTVKEVGRYTYSGSATTKHLKVLYRAQLVSFEKRGTSRILRLNAETLKEAADWIGRFQKAWDEQEHVRPHPSDRTFRNSGPRLKKPAKGRTASAHRSR